MEKEFDFQQIEDYVVGKLDAKARKAFEARLATDENLAREVAFYQDIIEVSEVLGDEDLEAEIKSVGAKLEKAGFGMEDQSAENAIKKHSFSTPKEPKIKKLPLHRILSIAAGFLILVVAGGLWWINANYGDQALATKYFHQEANALLRNAAPGEEDVLGSGLQFLTDENYAEAKSFFEAVPKSDEAFREARLYLALAQFKSKEYTAAASNAALAAQTKTHFQEKARWLQINALLAAGQTGAEFESLLNDMSVNSPDNYYRREAAKLKAQYESFWRTIRLSL